MVRSNGIADFAHREWVEMYGRIVGNVRSEMESQGRGDEFVGSKVSKHDHPGKGLCSSERLDSHRSSIQLYDTTSPASSWNAT